MGVEKARAGRSDDGRARCLRCACRCADVSGRELSGEQQLARTQQQKQKRRRGNRLRRVTCCERKQDLGEKSRIGDEVGVIGEVLVEWCGRGGDIIKEKSLGGSSGCVERMGLWGPGEGWSDPRDARGRACRSKAVEAEVEPTTAAMR